MCAWFAVVLVVLGTTFGGFQRWWSLETEFCSRSDYLGVLLNADSGSNSQMRLVPSRGLDSE